MTDNFNLERLPQPWVRLMETDTEKVSKLEEITSMKFDPTERSVLEDRDYVIIPIEQIVCEGQDYRETRMLMILGKDALITLERNRFDSMEELSRTLEHANAARMTPIDLALQIMTILNGAARNTARRISMCLDGYSQQVLDVSGGFETHGRLPGVADIADTVIALSEAEELVAKTLEGQLQLARAARWVRRSVTDPALLKRIELMLSDIESLRRFVHFQHEKVRNLEESLMTTLDIKQNQITKVFSVITAVFTPPTLVGAFYGQNFSYMPELTAEGAEWFVIFWTAMATAIPMWYIHWKGWMR